MKIIIATQNPHKVEEIKEIAKLYNISGIEFLPIDKSLNFNPVEDGETFEENSIIKAKEANRLTKEFTLADDSGLCVEALNGAPGIHSARYADTAQKRIDKLLDAIKGQTNRNAATPATFAHSRAKTANLYHQSQICARTKAVSRQVSCHKPNETKRFRI